MNATRMPVEAKRWSCARMPCTVMQPCVHHVRRRVRHYDAPRRRSAVVPVESCTARACLTSLYTLSPMSASGPSGPRRRAVPRGPRSSCELPSLSYHSSAAAPRQKRRGRRCRAPSEQPRASPARQHAWRGAAPAGQGATAARCRPHAFGARLCQLVVVELVRAQLHLSARLAALEDVHVRLGVQLAPLQHAVHGTGNGMERGIVYHRVHAPPRHPARPGGCIP